ncbi:ubiquitin carboxyl-terminal hydrolase 21-like [Andrographis paniculata]|uniref:ubiquitin carboxyl-terminal hydrolase 21-like n=1 Tax=Andrographis paniculata TaxID=175694 RepID=UPI0021E90BF7|nr:ubiquitin carboxyl-terminal hydrolase 21-like [Andrographis paniculata]
MCFHLRIAMDSDSEEPFPPPGSAETLGYENPHQQPASPNSDYFSPRSDDGSQELYDSPLMVEEEIESRGSNDKSGDEFFNSSPRSAVSFEPKFDQVRMEPLESESPTPLSFKSGQSAFTDGGFVASHALQQRLRNRKLSLAGGGMANLGNSCFLNSVLQCLLHTAPLLNSILFSKHVIQSQCVHGFCLVCSLQHLIELSLTASENVIFPSGIVNNLCYISSIFKPFQQEDANEFFQCFLDKLETCDSEEEECKSSKRGNIVKQIFGGRLVSKLKCCSCGHSSNTYEPLVDMSMEIEDADNLITALQSFTKVEKLDPEIKITCENCKEKVSVEKQLSLDQPPNIAVFHLKRFQSNGYKIDKHVPFPLYLDLLPFVDRGSNRFEDLNYLLYAVLVHIELTPTCGHYCCFIRIFPKVWFKFDDSQVYQVDEDYVLSQEAYILFYAREGTPWYSSYIDALTSVLNIPLNTSPKSVLESAPAMSPDLQEKPTPNSNSNEASNDISKEHRVGKIEIKYTRLSCNNPESSKCEDEPASAVPSAHYSSDASPSPSEVQKEVPPVNQSEDAPSQVKSEDILQELMQPPSPEIYRDDPSDVGFSMPREHARLSDRISCKRRLDKEMDDMETRQACALIKKTSKGSRAQQLLSAVKGAQSDPAVSRKKGRRSELSNGPHASDGSSVRNARHMVAGTYR